MSGVLDGVRVIELTTMISGPFAGMLLADLGASVIKIENPPSGDPFRSFRGGLYSGHFIAYNRNKRGMTLDLSSDRGREIFLKLAGTTDVLIDNFRPGVLDRLGITEKKLSEANPKLIHASITGFGPDGPYVSRPSYDTVAQSLSGVLSQFLDPENPQITGPTLVDNVSGLYTAYAILGALYQRQRTGLGRRIQTNMLETAIAFAPDAFISHKRDGLRISPTTRASGSQSFALRCQDGELIALHLSSHQKFWDGVLKALDRNDLATNPDFATRERRMTNYKALGAELAKVFATRPLSEWEKRLEANDVPYAPVLNVEKVPDDAQVRHLGTFYQARHSSEGEIWGAYPPILYDGKRPGEIIPPPVLGEHTEEILGEIGVSAEKLDELRKRKIV